MVGCRVWTPTSCQIQRFFFGNPYLYFFENDPNSDGWKTIRAVSFRDARHFSKGEDTEHQCHQNLAIVVVPYQEGFAIGRKDLEPGITKKKSLTQLP